MAIIINMVTFCLGSARQKRAYVKSIKDGVLLDNIEVLFCVSENGRNYFAYAPVPFSDFRVHDYLKYRRALCGDKITEFDIRRFGLSPRTKIGRLAAAERRIVQYLEKTCGKATGPIIINLDGIRYSRRGMAALNRLISALSVDVYVFVTDVRYVRRFKGKRDTITFGSQSKPRTHRFYSAKLLAQRVGANKISIM